MFDSAPKQELYQYVTEDEAEAVLGAFRAMMAKADPERKAIGWVEACEDASVSFSQWQMERKFNPTLQAKIASIDEEILERVSAQLRFSALHGKSAKSMKELIELEKVRTVFGAPAGGGQVMIDARDPFALSGDVIRKQKEKANKTSMEKQAKQIAGIDERALIEASETLKAAASADDADPMKREVIRGADPGE